MHPVERNNCISVQELVQIHQIRSRSSSGTNHRHSILDGIRGMMSGRQRSESVGNEKRAILRLSTQNGSRRIQIKNCPVESVYDLREEDELDDLYNDSFAFRRPRSNSSDLLILRKTSRPLTVDVVGLVEGNTNPYMQYAKVVNCYELAPRTGSIILVDSTVKLEKTFRILYEWGKTATLIWSEKKQCVISLLTFTDLFNFLLSGKANSSSYIADALSNKKLITINSSYKLLEACKQILLNRIFRIAVTEPSGDIIYLLDLKRILEAVHKQNRSLHLTLWLDCPVSSSNIGTWNDLHIIEENETISGAVKKMIEYQLCELPIVDSKGEAKDVICKADIAFYLANTVDIQKHFESETVTNAVTYRAAAWFANEKDTIRRVLEQILSESNCRCVFIKNSLSNELLGAISLIDLITYVLNTEQQLDQQVQNMRIQ